jgi:hypothetical protein
MTFTLPYQVWAENRVGQTMPDQPGGRSPHYAGLLPNLATSTGMNLGLEFKI